MNHKEGNRTVTKPRFLKDVGGLKRGKFGQDDNNRRFGSIIRVPGARPNSLTWAKLWPRNAGDKRSKFLLSSAGIGGRFDEYSGFRRVVDASPPARRCRAPLSIFWFFGKLLRPPARGPPIHHALLPLSGPYISNSRCFYPFAEHSSYLPRNVSV